MGVPIRQRSSYNGNKCQHAKCQCAWLIPICVVVFTIVLALIIDIFADQTKIETVTNLESVQPLPDNDYETKNTKRAFGFGYKLNGKWGFGYTGLMLYSF